MTNVTESEIMRWLSNLNEEKVLGERADLAMREQQLEQTIKNATDELEKVRIAKAAADSVLRLKRALLSPGAGLADLVTPAPAQNGTVEVQTPAPARGREAVRALMAAMPEVTEWTNPLVLRELVKRGWADPDDTHSVGVSLSRMYRKGELERPRIGVYRLPRNREGSLLSSGEDDSG